MPDFELELAIVPETGLSIGGSGSTGVRADKTVLRDGQQRPIIPASQVKGRLRHACEAILRGAGVLVCRPPNPELICPHLADIPDPPCPICDIFGSTWHPSPLRFSDLVPKESGSEDRALSADEVRTDRRPGTGIDRRRRIVKDELLFFTETVDQGAAPVFGNKKAIAGTLDERGQALLLLAGLKSIRNWGGGKSRGLGWATVSVEATLDGETLELDEVGKEELARWLSQHIA